MKQEEDPDLIEALDLWVRSEVMTSEERDAVLGLRAIARAGLAASVALNTLMSSASPS